MAKIRRCPADTAFSDALRLSRGYVCEHCHVQGEKGLGYPMMDMAHIYSRKHKAIRWDTLNGLCLCRACHMAFEADGVDFTRFLDSYVGKGYMDLLREKRNQIQKDTKAYRKEVAAHYREQIRLMEAGQHDLVSFQ